MKKITEAEFDSLLLKGTGNASKFYKAIISLKPGEGIIISNDEYHLSYSPGRICKKITKRFPHVKYSYGRIADGTGWAVKRVE